MNNAHIKRLLEMSNYNPKKGKINESECENNELSSSTLPLIAPVVAIDGNGTMNEQAPIDQNFDRELTTALDQVMRTLPQAMANFAKTKGDHDGQIEPIGNGGNVQEAELNEAIGALAAGIGVALPAIGNIIGKTVSFLGKKVDSQTTQRVGKYIEHKAEQLHHKYDQILDKALSPLTMYMQNENQKQMIKKLVFYGIIAALGGAGIAGATKAVGAGKLGLATLEGGLSTVKASEIIAAAKDVIPRVLAQFIK